MLNPGDFLGSIDLKDAYFIIPIYTEHQKYLQLQIQPVSVCSSPVRPFKCSENIHKGSQTNHCTPSSNKEFAADW